LIGGGPADIPGDAIVAPQTAGAVGLTAVSLVSESISVLDHGFATGNFTDAAAFAVGAGLAAASGSAGDSATATAAAGVAVNAFEDAVSSGKCPG
jgi:hypothetical protein